MTARRTHRCVVCGRQRRYARPLCSTCRQVFGPMLAGLRELPERVAS